jgi:DNA topoisomerase-1
LKLGKFGAFIGCSNYPECKVTKPLAVAGGENGEGAAEQEGPKLLGKSASGYDVTLRQGPYGPYVQEGDADTLPPVVKETKKGGRKETPAKPKRVSLPKGLEPADVDLDKALALLTLPRDIGTHPETGTKILAGIGRFGPYLKHGDLFKSIPAGDDVLTIGLNRAVVLLAEPKKGRGGQAVKAEGRTLGNHPEDGKPVVAHSGRYGPYVAHSGVNATLPKDIALDSITLEQAIPLLAARKAKGPAKKPFKRGAKKG